jgi:hypothetical protein
MNKDIDWNKVKFRASSWGNLMTEPKSAEDKKAGNLGTTCIKELIKIYNLKKYGRKKDLTTNKMEKGTIGEEDSITLFSRVEKRMYYKNQIRLENEWFEGHPDIGNKEEITESDEIWDIKTRWELDTFMPKLAEKVDKAEEYQLNVYFDLTGAQGGGIANTLIDCPPGILMDEKRRLLFSMPEATTEFSPVYLEAAAELEHLLTFPDIDYRERVIKQPVQRNDELIEKMKSKVPIFRQWLEDFEKKHLSLYKTKELI